MSITTYQIYLLAGFVILGLVDLYLYRYPIFHPIVLLTGVGYFWSEFSHGLIVGGVLELIFGIAQIRETRRLNLILYAGGLAIYLNQQTHNINLSLCMAFGLLLALGLQLIMEPVRDWLRWLILVVFSIAAVFLLPLLGEILGYIPASLLNHIAVAGGILPWIFFAYAIWSLSSRTRHREVTLAIPAILIGSYLAIRLNFWGAVVFVGVYYILDVLLKHREVEAIRWLDWLLVIVGIYLMLPNLSWLIVGVFAGILILNIVLVVRKFAPLEIYLLILIIGIILSQGRLLS